MTGNLTRRDFVKSVALSGSAIALFGDLKLLHATVDDSGILRSIVVDYGKCAGCRTCETACSASNHPLQIDGDSRPGPGNPFLANIRVQHYNPDVDIPAVCAICPDAPCIEVCPISAEAQTGRKAIYRDEKTATIRNDIERCIGCGRCADACATQRVGIIVPNPHTNKPERMCTLCDGNPQCVENCPFDALSYVEVDTQREQYGRAPNEVAVVLNERFYDMPAPTAVTAAAATLPKSAALLPAYPNPSNSTVWFPYRLNHDAEVTIRIINALGQSVRKLRIGRRISGSYLAHWDGRTDEGATASSGVYCYSLHAGTFVDTRRFVLLK